MNDIEESFKKLDNLVTFKSDRRKILNIQPGAATPILDNIIDKLEAELYGEESKNQTQHD